MSLETQLLPASLKSIWLTLKSHNTYMRSHVMDWTCSPNIFNRNLILNMVNILYLEVGPVEVNRLSEYTHTNRIWKISLFNSSYGTQKTQWSICIVTCLLIYARLLIVFFTVVVFYQIKDIIQLKWILIMYTLKCE